MAHWPMERPFYFTHIATTGVLGKNLAITTWSKLIQMEANSTMVDKE
jgi:hypothetical protein